MSEARQLPPRARWFVVAVVCLGAAATIWANLLDPPALELRTLLFVLMAAGAGLVKVPLPVGGSVSLAYAFIFATLMGFGLGASALAGVLSTLASAAVSRLKGARPPIHRTAFNAGLIGIACLVGGLGYVALGGPTGALALPGHLLPVVAYTAIFVAVNLGLVSWVMHLSGEQRLRTALGALLRWTVPGYLAGSSLAILLGLLLDQDHPLLLLLAGPFLFLVHAAYRTRTEQVEEARRHSEQTAELYRCVTTALALAIEAKDENTEEHLQRVQQYCLGIGELLGLPDPELEALRAAALLHDIGKIAVPEYVLTKPGRLTAEEQELMRVHPVVGAEILGAVPFPYPLAPIVRHHHERWDGQGYPDGLAGEAIPRGARILTTVDCYDALISDRPYRKAIPRGEAFEFLLRESGRMFDPQVVEVLLHNADTLERRVEARAAASRPAQATRSPSAGSGHPPAPRPVPEVEILAKLELPASGDPPQWSDVLRPVSVRLATVLPFRTVVVYGFDRDKTHLVVAFASGKGSTRLDDLVIRVGDRVAGWAALHQRPYRGSAHRNPVERDGSRFDLEDLVGDPEVAGLGTELVAPLTTDAGRLGVLAVYHDAEFEYSDEQLELLSGAARTLAHLLATCAAPLSELPRASRG